ncbi:MAG: membrane protein insertase YidC [Syntrophorhabdales bacterium]|jgi:YidC/Oxa1 family membrane protein insertase
MEKRTIIAVVLSIGILFVWQYLFTPKTTHQPTGQGGVQSPARGGGTSNPAQGQAASPQGMDQAVSPPGSTAAQEAVRQVTVDTSKMTIVLQDVGGGITSVRLREYKETVGGLQGKELIQNISPYQYLPTVSLIENGKAEGDDVRFASDRGDIVVRDKPERLVFSGILASGARVTKTYTFYPDSYSVGVAVLTEGADKGGTAYADFAVMSLKEKSSGYIFKGPFVYDGGRLDQIAKSDKPVNAGTAYEYAGFDEGYFSFIMAPGDTRPDLLVTKVQDTPVERLISAKGAFDATLYFVPNKISLLKGLNINADKIVNFGWFDIIAKPMLWGMNYANRFTHNYGIDIILLTILIKIIFYPLSLKGYKSMKNMQKLQPKIAQLREKYKNDKEKLNQEMMGIYKKEGANPLGGCLPMVIQIPVFFALYKVLMAAIEFRHAPFMLWINDLAAPEDLFTLHVAGYALPLRLLPLIMGITMVIQQKMTPTAGDPMQAKMMMFMPIFFTFLFWGFPAGLVLYWLVNNVISIGQQYYINKQVA